jgi:15-cis-phytoene synthase
MQSGDPDTLPPEAELALAWTPSTFRPALDMALRLDRRLARIVARTTEPMLGQMRLAWWREALGKPAGDRPRGDAVLDGLGQHWAGREAALIALIDGWEVLVSADALGPDAIAAFGMGRGAFFGALTAEGVSAARDQVAAAAFRWAVADAATAVSDPEERAQLIAGGTARSDDAGRLPRDLRGLAVLDALARRSLRRGGLPLMDGRGASLTALRAAIFLS